MTQDKFFNQGILILERSENGDNVLAWAGNTDTAEQIAAALNFTDAKTNESDDEATPFRGVARSENNQFFNEALPMNVVQLPIKKRTPPNGELEKVTSERLNHKAVEVLSDGLELMMAIERGIEMGDEWELLAIASQIRERRANASEYLPPVAVFATAQAIIEIAGNSCGGENEIAK